MTASQPFPPVKIGLIGCGVIGRHHAQAASNSSRAELWAVADLRGEVAQEIGTAHGAKQIYTDAESLIADTTVEAVVLAMPAHLRTELALQAFAAGKHVLTEKPVAMNAEEVAQLIEAKGDLVAACCSSRYQFLDASRKVTDFIASGALGNLRTIRCRAIAAAGAPPQNPPPPWRLNRSLNGGGILMNWGCYDLDYLLGITGWTLRPSLVLASIWTVPPAFENYAAPNSDAETHVTALIRCENNITLTYERAEFIAAQRELSWEIIGDAGALRLQMTPAADTAHVYFQRNDKSGTSSQVLCNTDEDHAAVHDGPIDDFARAIQEGSAPQTNLERALLVQKITDAIYHSAESGEAIKIV